MATITLTVTGATATRVVNAICAVYNYQTLINGLPNPQIPIDFVKSIIVRIVKNEVKAYEANIAAQTALATAQADAETNIVIT